MSSLQQMLTDYAIESGVIEDHAGNPSEFTVSTMDTMTALEVEIEELEKQTDDATDEVDHLVKSSEAVVSAESLVINHMNLINRLGYDGEYTRTTQRLAWSGLEESLESLGFNPNMFGGLINDYSFEADEPKEQAAADSEKSKGFLKRFWDLLVTIAKRMKAVFVRFIDLFRSSAEKNKRSIEILGNEITKRSTGTVKEGDMKTSAFAMLMWEGKIDPAQAITKSASNFHDNILGAQKHIHGEVDKLHQVLNNISASKTFLQKAGAALKKIATLGMATDKIKARDVLTGIYNNFPKAFSFKLAGGITAAYVVNTTSEGQLGIKFSVGKTTVEAPATSPVPSMAVIKSIHEVMKLGQKTIDDIIKLMDIESKATDLLIKKVDELSKISFETKADNELAHTIGSAVQALVGVGNTFLPAYNKYTIKLQHSSYKYAMSALSRYTKGDAKPADAKDADPKAKDAK